MASVTGRTEGGLYQCGVRRFQTLARARVNTVQFEGWTWWKKVGLTVRSPVEFIPAAEYGQLRPKGEDSLSSWSGDEGRVAGF